MGVYFIRNTVTDSIKIGCSGVPRARLENLQIGNEHQLEIVAHVPEWGSDEERDLHGGFYAWRLRGEWFRGNAHGLGALIAWARGEGRQPLDLGKYLAGLAGQRRYATRASIDAAWCCGNCHEWNGGAG